MLINKISKTLFIPLIVIVFIFYYCPFAKAYEVKKIKVVVENVVSETEEGYVSTNKGIFDLPSLFTEIDIENTKLDLLIDNLKKIIGKESVLYVDGNTVVGIFSESQKIEFMPNYRKREKKKYTLLPLKISTKLTYWNTDSYRLSIRTSDGTFCIFNTFEVSDYYNKVYKKLKEHYKEKVVVNAKIIIFYHKIEDSYECQGEVEDVEF